MESSRESLDSEHVIQPDLNDVGARYSSNNLPNLQDTYIQNLGDHHLSILDIYKTQAAAAIGAYPQSNTQDFLEGIATSGDAGIGQRRWSITNMAFGPGVKYEGHQVALGVTTGRNRRLSDMNIEDAKQVARKQYYAKLKRSASIAFYLSLIGSAVGFGNIWRFPTEVSKGGGLAYLIIYLICAILFAFPLGSLEIIYGQFSRGTPFDAGLMSGQPRGLVLGASIFGLIGLLSYYSVLIVWVLMYLVRSVSQPWASTPDDAIFCEALGTQAMCLAESCYFPYEQALETVCCSWHNVLQGCIHDINAKSATWFYQIQTYNNSGWFYDSTASVRIENINWQQFGAHCVYATLLFLATMGGRKLMDYVMYATMVPAMLIVIGLFCYSFTLPGASDGVHQYLFGSEGRFAYEAFWQIDKWKQAIIQVIVSMSLGAFVVPVLSADCPFTQAVGVDSLVVTFADAVFGIISGFIVYCMLGFVAGQVGTTVSELQGSGGASLIFVVYAAGLSAVDKVTPGLSTALHLCFWIMFTLLGFTSCVTLVSSLADWLAKSKMSRTLLFPEYSTRKGSMIFSGIICVCLLLTGLLTCSDMGPFLVDPFDKITGEFILPISITCSSVIFTWGLRADQEKAEATKPVYYAMRAWISFCVVIGGCGGLFVEEETAGIIFAVFILIMPVTSTLVFAKWCMVNRAKKGDNMTYSEAWNLVFNGYFGHVLEHISEIINHDVKRPFDGLVFAGISGLVRWLGVPFLAAISISTLSHPEQLISYAMPMPESSPDWTPYLIPQQYPKWVQGLASLLFLGYISVTLIGIASPFSLGWFTNPDSNPWHGLFQRRSYCFGLIDVREKAELEIAAPSESDKTSLSTESSSEKII